MCNHHFPGKVCIPDPARVKPDGTGVPVISFDANNGDVFVGGPPGGFGKRGRLIINDKDGKETFSLDGQSGELNLKGDLCVKDKAGNKRVCLSGPAAQILITTANGQQVLLLGPSANIIAGGGGVDGDLILRNGTGQDVFQLGADEQNLVIKKPTGEIVVELGRQGNLFLGGGGDGGDVVVRTGQGQVTIRLDGETGNLHVGASGQAGDVFVNDATGLLARIHLEGSSGNARFDGAATVQKDLTVGGKTTTKDLTVTGMAEVKQNLAVSEKTTTKTLEVTQTAEVKRDLTVVGRTTTKDLTVTGKADLQQGVDTTNLTAKNITLTNSSGQETVKILGEEGDIQLLNADCAEDFDIVETEDIEPGTVMVLDQQGRLCSSSLAYDKKVAGVISGAGHYKPGLVLDKQISSNKRLPVALMGKVYCKVDAAYAPVEVGDLLTTSTTPGYAMKADNPLQAFGAVIGKALQPLNEGRGLIPVLVALQ